MDHEARFRVWFQSLPKKKREELEQLGAGLASVKDPSIGGMRELDEQQLESDRPHSQAELINKALLDASLEQNKGFSEDIPTAKLIRLMHFFVEVMDSAHHKDSALLHAQIVRIVLGIGDPPPQRVLAKKYGVPRSTVNKRVKRLQQMLGLPPSKFMFSEHHCASFSLGHTLSFLREKADASPQSRKHRSSKKQ